MMKDRWAESYSSLQPHYRQPCDRQASLGNARNWPAPRSAPVERGHVGGCKDIRLFYYEKIYVY